MKETGEIESLNAGSGGREPIRILVIRPDRLGDVVLSTPVMEVIKRHYSRSHLVVMVREQVAPILRGLPSLDEVQVFDPQGVHSGFKGFFRLVRQIREGRYQAAVVLQSHWKIAAALFLARVRHRIGPLSKIHSFLFYNRGVRQRRSHVEMHETDYNLQLLRKLGIRVGTRNVLTRVHISDETKRKSHEWLKAHGWVESEPTVMVHPGMGGSALNWPENHYQELIQILLREGVQVLLTGGPTEGPLLDRIRATIGDAKKGVLCFKATYETPIDFLGGLYSFAHVVVAPSTGPLHLAVALEKPVVTFYPPIRVQSALRWGPYLADDSKGSILIPEVYCGQDFECLGNMCNYFPCMKTLTVKQALEEVQLHLSPNRVHS